MEGAIERLPSGIPAPDLKLVIHARGVPLGETALIPVTIQNNATNKRIVNLSVAALMAHVLVKLPTVVRGCPSQNAGSTIATMPAAAIAS